MQRYNRSATKYIFWFSLVLFFVSVAHAYSVDPPSNVHQHISQESGAVWNLIPYDVKQHLTEPVNSSLDGEGYHAGEDIITGSGEEDTEWLWRNILCFGRPFCQHFWEPDNPQSEEYNDGLNVVVMCGMDHNCQSAYTKAREYWITYVIPYYLKGQINESYYGLGRVTHLLEDATVPEHMHLDCHIGSYEWNWLSRNDLSTLLYCDRYSDVYSARDNCHPSFTSKKEEK